MKLYVYKGDVVIVYVSGGNFIFFELEKNLYLIVYMLWFYFDFLLIFIIWFLVFEKLVGGVDLMLFGLVMFFVGLF